MSHSSGLKLHFSIIMVLLVWLTDYITFHFSMCEYMLHITTDVYSYLCMCVTFTITDTCVICYGKRYYYVEKPSFDALIVKQDLSTIIQ